MGTMRRMGTNISSKGGVHPSSFVTTFFPSSFSLSFDSCSLFSTLFYYLRAGTLGESSFRRKSKLDLHQNSSECYVPSKSLKRGSSRQFVSRSPAQVALLQTFNHNDHHLLKTKLSDIIKS